MKFLLGLFAALLAAAPAQAEVGVRTPSFVRGNKPEITIVGLSRAERVRVHMFRLFSQWTTDDPAKRTGWRQVPIVLHSWADVQGSKAGTVSLRTFRVSRGTYRGADAYGLLWSGRKPGDPLLAGAEVPAFDPASLRDGEMRVIVTRGPEMVAQASLKSIAPPNLVSEHVAKGTVNGAYAAPADGKRHSTVILLHGSEGGDPDSAREIAQRFAGQGFAAFALNYFAWDLKNIPGVPNAHVNQPIELLADVRAWLREKPEANVDRIGVYGHSKGAEYAAVAAVRLPWIRAVAACVPSDSVWEGYGIGDARNRPDPARTVPKQVSSWSWQGAPLPYIALPPSDDRSRFFDNTAYYEARRAADPLAARAARIPVERSSAHFLWLGAGRDETWASGAMAASNDAALRRAGKGLQSELRVYPSSSHAICGDGTYPTHLWIDQSSDPRRPDLDADGAATVDAWRRIVAFFRRTL